MSEQKNKQHSGEQIPCFECGEFVYQKGYGHHLDGKHPEVYQIGLIQYPDIHPSYNWPEAVAARKNGPPHPNQGHRTPSIERARVASAQPTAARAAEQIRALCDTLQASVVVDLFGDIIKAKYRRAAEALAAIKDLS